MRYINHDLIRAENWLEKRLFLHQWAQIGFRDRRWVPPLFFKLRPSLADAHIQRMRTGFFRLSAIGVARRNAFQGAPSPNQGMPIAPLIEETIATAMLQLDPRRPDRTTCFCLFRTVNDRDSLRVLFDSMGELLRDAGSFRLLGPFGLSPYLERGVLQSHWDATPPVYTAYNQPFLPELMNRVLRPFATQHLYSVPLAANSVTASSDAIALVPLDPIRLATDLLPLLQAACHNHLGLPLPDEAEARFILRQLFSEQLLCWGAEVDGRVVGFFLAQPDDGAARRRSRGGKLAWQIPLYRLWSQRPVQRGRLLFGAVLPGYRRRGVGQTLLNKLATVGASQGWDSVQAGPLDGRETAVAWLTRHANATPQQAYTLFEFNV